MVKVEVLPGSDGNCKGASDRKGMGDTIRLRENSVVSASLSSVLEGPQLLHVQLGAEGLLAEESSHPLCGPGAWVANRASPPCLPVPSVPTSGACATLQGPTHAEPCAIVQALKIFESRGETG